MHHVHDCNRVLEVRRGLVVSSVLPPPTSLKDRVIKALELCSCGKKNIKLKVDKTVAEVCLPLGLLLLTFNYEIVFHVSYIKSCKRLLTNW